MIRVGPRYSVYELIPTTPEFLSQVSRPANVLWACCDYHSALNISVEVMMEALLPRPPPPYRTIFWCLVSLYRGAV